MTLNPLEGGLIPDQTDEVQVSEVNDLRYIAYVDPRGPLLAGSLMPPWVSLIPYEAAGEMSATLYGHWRVMFSGTRPSNVTPPEPRVPIRVSDQRTRVSLVAAVTRLQELQQLRPGWDSYGGSPISAVAIENSLTILIAALAKGAPVPAIVPTSTGGVQLEWHNSRCDLELEISDRLATAFLSLRGDHVRTWEGTLVSTGWHLDRFLNYLL